METTTASRLSGDNLSGFRMVDVGEKAETPRRAVAQGRLLAAPETIQKIQFKQLPKGDALALSEVAGILGAKRTSEMLPLCHPLTLDSIRIWHEFEECAVTVLCEVKCRGKTGVEMEALSGVNAALLCLYDVTKMIDPVLRVSEIQLNLKEGGKSGKWLSPLVADEGKKTSALSLNGIRCSVLTLSDRCSRGEAQDQSGPYLVEKLVENGADVDSALTPDDVSKATYQLRSWIDQGVDLVVCTGGTGLGPRDITPEIFQELRGKMIPGIGELLRQNGARFTPHSWLSRSEGYLVQKTLIILLPGSLKAVEQGWDVIHKLIPHALKMIRGGNHS